jgi:subtilisin family serine protease
MKEKITTLFIMAILLMATIPVIKVNVIADKESNFSQSTQSMPEQCISPQLLEKLAEAGLNSQASDEMVKILIRHKTNVDVELPEGVEILKRFSLVPIISASAPLSMIEEISKLPGVEYVYLDLKMEIASDEGLKLPYPDYSSIKDWQNAQLLDEELPYNQWFGNYPAYLNETTELIGATDLWSAGITGKNVTIAIIDTGINKYHPDLDDMDDDPLTCDPKVLAEVSFVPSEPPDDWHGHGTHVASIAAGTGATGAMDFIGTFPDTAIHNATILPGTERGVAPGAYLYNAKAFDQSGSGEWSWIISAIEWSVARGADVISGSFGGWPDVPADQDPVVLALKEAVEHGVVVVIAAGNDGFGYFTVGTPGFAPDVITVGATSETDHLIYFSSRGPEQFELHAKPDIVAPGTSVVAAFAFYREYEEYYGLQTFYLEMSGTSMATPHVSGAAALLLQAFPGATPYTIKAAMMQSADDLELDSMAQGAGRLNVKTAYDIMNAAPKTQWAAPTPMGIVEAKAPAFVTQLNLTGKSILIDASLSNVDKFINFISLLQNYGASITYGFVPYTNATLVDQITGQPNYDVFIIPDPYIIDTLMLPPNTLEHYVQHNGTLLIMGENVWDLEAYNEWTEIWGVTWNNTAVGGFSSHMNAHAITSGITELYFGSPVASLIVNASMNAETVVWDPIFPGVAVWEATAPARGKVVVISDDAILSDQFLYMADNLQFGLNIITWFTNASETEFFQDVMFFDDVESGSDGWTSTGFWHITDHRSYSSSYAWYYGQDTVWNYDDGMRNSGNLTSPQIVLGSGYSAHLIFRCWYETETGLSYDQKWIYISVDSGPFVPLMLIYRDATGVWYTEEIDLSAFMGHTIRIRFLFDTIDSIANDYEGWYIDDVAVTVEKLMPTYHEIGVGGTWPEYVLANRTATISVNVTNFGTYMENVTLYMNGINVENITNLLPSTSAIVDITMKLNATTMCDLSGVNMTSFSIWGVIFDPELNYSNNGFYAEIAAAPKGERIGDNPLLSVMTPMKIESLSMPLITMYPEDFTLHNLTAFVGGGALVNAQFRITGNVSQIADFVDVTQFTYHIFTELYGEVLPDPSPAYFILNTTSIIGNTLSIGDISAPAMLFAELQVYIAEGTPFGTYTGQVELVNGTTTIASTGLSFNVQKPKYKVLWEDYYNDYANYWADCERLWGGAEWGVGVSEWWKMAAEAGFDVDSLHQQLYFKQHSGFLIEAVDPLEIIAYGGYDALYMHDVDFNFRANEILVFRQLYETGKMDFAISFDDGSQFVSLFTSNYGISLTGPWILDLLVTGLDKTHPIFADVDNFTMLTGPLLTVTPSDNEKSVTTGIATGTDDYGLSWGSGFVVAVNEMQATSHYTSRMVTVSGGMAFELLEYSDFMAWYYALYFTGQSLPFSKVDTDKFAVNMLRWLDPQFTNESPVVDSVNITPTTSKLGETISVDAVVHDPEDDNFNVTIAVQKPDNSWDNVTIASVGGHWLRSFATDLEGTYLVYVVATDTYDATTFLLGGTVNAENMAPEIVSASILPSKVGVGENVFITVNAKDAEDGAPANIWLSVTDPDATSYTYVFADEAFATVIFDTSNKPEGIYTANATVRDANGAETTAIIGFFEVKNLPPNIVSYSISSNKVVVGEVISITASGEDPEDIIPAKITISIINPVGVRQDFNYSNVAAANVVFDTTSKAEGIYQVEVTVQDSNGGTTTATVDSFEITAVGLQFPVREATLGIGIIALVVLILILFLVYRRFPAPSAPTPPPVA